MKQRIGGLLCLIFGMAIINAGAPLMSFGDLLQSALGLILAVGGGAALFGTDFPKSDGEPSERTFSNGGGSGRKDQIDNGFY